MIAFAVLFCRHCRRDGRAASAGSNRHRRCRAGGRGLPARNVRRLTAKRRKSDAAAFDHRSLALRSPPGAGAADERPLRRPAPRAVRGRCRSRAVFSYVDSSGRPPGGLEAVSRSVGLAEQHDLVLVECAQQGSRIHVRLGHRSRLAERAQLTRRESRSDSARRSSTLTRLPRRIIGSREARRADARRGSPERLAQVLHQDRQVQRIAR